MHASCVTALFFLALAPTPASAQQPFVLNDGTPLRVRLNRTVSSADAKVGEPVDFDVVEDIFVNGAVVIQRGSRVLATVTEAQSKGMMGKSGKLDVSLDHARSVLGEKIALRAVKENDRGDSAGLGSIATSIVTAPLLLFMKGKDVTLSKGTEVTAYVHGDIRLDEARVRAHSLNAAPTPAETAVSPTPAPAQAPPAPTTPQTVPAQAAAPGPQVPPAAAPRAPAPGSMTNADVLALKTAGFSDDLIVAKIKSSRCAFQMETSDMINLKMAGLSDRVIGAMMEKTQ
jgi:hypothetical protein